jgi:hypothetical protein
MYLPPDLPVGMGFSPEGERKWGIVSFAHESDGK